MDSHLKTRVFKDCTWLRPTARAAAPPSCRLLPLSGARCICGSELTLNWSRVALGSWPRLLTQISVWRYAPFKAKFTACVHLRLQGNILHHQNDCVRVGSWRVGRAGWHCGDWNIQIDTVVFYHSWRFWRPLTWRNPSAIAAAPSTPGVL